mgnify:CR=1 FL=1
MIPEKAVIIAATREEADRLMEYLHQNGYKWINGISLFGNCQWDMYGKRTVYNLEPGKRLCYGSVGYYSRQKDADKYWMPKDLSWFLIPADEFIARCESGDLQTESEIDFHGIDRLL